MIPEFIRRKFAKRIDIHENYQVVFSTPQGKEVLEHILNEGFIFKTTCVKVDGTVDVNHTLVNEGKRMLALSIIKFAHKDHSAVVKQIEQQLEQLEQT